MKKLVIILGVLTVSLTSCLKDKPNVDFSNIGTFAEFPHSGKSFFSADAITDAGDTVTRDFTINITGQYAPSKDITVTLATDDSQIAQFNTPALTYEPTMPTAAYKLSATSVTIKAGTRLATVTATFYKNKLDLSKSYMLPVIIKSASGGVSLSANLNTHYLHFIGNDFAGAYKADFIRTPAGGNYTGEDVNILPVSPSQFEVGSGYAGLGVKYEVTFVKHGVGAAATYTDWKVVLNSDDVKNIFNAANGINVVNNATFVSYDPGHAYTYAEATHGLFKFVYDVTNSAGAPRNLVDYYYKP